ncbi:ABC transporter permease [Streptomyces gamaensis]|uniref:ABC transporter permease n=1 Tax=Streptomyces gamaensis TaxID=1763542 RepID=A0ABW0Z6G1_9ACTN
MFRTALRNVLAHKGRLLMTVLAVLLGVAFVSGTLVFTSTISNAQQNSLQKGFTGVDVAIHTTGRAAADPEAGPGRPGERPALSQQLLDKAATVPGAASASGSVAGYAAVAGKDGKLASEGQSPRGANYYPGGDGKDARYPLKDGRGPRAAGEIALDAKTAERAGYKVGDTVRVSVDGPVLPQKLTGIFTSDDGSVEAGNSLTLFDTATAQKFYGKQGEFNEIAVKAAPGTSQTVLKAELDKILPSDTETVTGKQLADEQAKMVSDDMKAMQKFLLIFAGIALFVGIFIIANTFSMLVAQRTKELALLRAVGASRRQVTRSVLTEAFVVGAIAAVTGLLAGIGIGAVLRSVVRDMGASIPDGPLVVSLSTVLTSLAVGVLVTMLAAWLPARRAAKIPPVAAMSSVHAVASAKSLVVRNSIGAALSALGVAVLLTGSANEMVLSGGAALLVLGVFVLTPLLSRPLIAAAEPVLRTFGISGKLARQNAVRNPRRTAATASALMIGLTLITGMTVVAGSMQQAVDKLATSSLKADFLVSMANRNPLSPEVEKTLASSPGVTAVSPVRESPARIGDGHTPLTGVDGRTIEQLAKPKFTSGSFAGLSGDKAVVDKELAKKRGWKVGSSLPVTFEDGKKGTLTVSGVYQGSELLNGIVVDTRTLAPHQELTADSRVLVKTETGANESAKDSLRKALGDNPAIQIADKKDISNSIAGAVNTFLNMMYGLLGMAVVVAVLGVVNTLAMSVFERSQEIGMLRAIGLDRKGIKRMVRLESLLISLFGGVLGIGLGVFFGWVPGDMIRKLLPDYAMVIPWGRMVLFLLLAAVVGVLAALWPARRAARLNMLAAIKAE